MNADLSRRVEYILLLEVVGLALNSEIAWENLIKCNNIPPLLAHTLKLILYCRNLRFNSILTELLRLLLRY